MNHPSKTIVLSGPMVLDLDPSYIDKDVVTFSRNMVFSTLSGNTFFRTNEPGNSLCVNAPYEIINMTPLNSREFLVFSTDNQNSEIGVADITNCTYRGIVSGECLGFNTSFLIQAKVRRNSYSEILVTFGASNIPVRTINLSKIPYKYVTLDDECQTKEFTNELDCDSLLLFRPLDFPNVSLNQGYNGVLPNCAVQVAVAYEYEKEVYSDYSISLPKHLYSKGAGNSLDVKLEGLDRNFDTYRLLLIATVKGVATAYVVGSYPTSVEAVTISSLDPDYVVVPLEALVVRKDVYERAGFISGNSKYLILADLTKKETLNTQIIQENTEVYYVVKQVPLDYYKNGGSDIGLWRREVYAFDIRYRYNTGEYTKDAHIYGRKAVGDELSLASGYDAYELFQDNPTKVYNFEVEDTAGDLIRENNPFINGERILGKGRMGYFQSTELYPDNKELYGDNACTPIRFFKTPSEAKVPRYEIIDGKTYLNIIGIEVRNIPHPVDENGVPVSNIVGYEILRADRSGGNRSVIAAGLLVNARGYTETQNQNLEVIYPNYGVNDLSPDSFLSKTQTSNKSNKERDFKPLDKVYRDKFTFHSPHGHFGNKYKMGREFVVEAEEIFEVSGQFEEVYQHPKDYLTTNFALYMSLLMGVIQGFLVTSPAWKKNTTLKVGLDAGTEIAEETQDSMGHSVILTNPTNVGSNFIQITKRVLQTLGKAGMFIYFSAEYASNALRVIKNYSKITNYALQFNASTRYLGTTGVRDGQRRRYSIAQPEYLGDGLQSIDTFVVNNFGRSSSVFVQLDREVAAPVNIDNSKRTMTEYRASLNSSVSARGSVLYATSKVKNPNQYGQLGSYRKVKTSSDTIDVKLTFDAGGNPIKYKSPVLFGGDCIIAEFSYLNKMPFFSQDLAGANFPDGNIQFNYNQYRNVAYPRFWADFSDYELGSLITASPSLGRMPANKHNLDGKGNSGVDNAFTVVDRYFYLSHNTAIKFIAEADYNIALRDEEVEVPFYTSSGINTSYVFRSDFLKKREVFSLDPSFTRLTADQVFPDPFQPDYTRLRNRERIQNALIYSDNWDVFLPGNYHRFSSNDFGGLTGVHQLDQDRIIFLFDSASPFISLGQDELQTSSGNAIAIGTGGLFARSPREIIHTDTFFGSSQSKNAFISTPAGAFYPSARSGRIFALAQKPQDITKSFGVHFWAKNYMPIKLYEYFPSYNKEENVLSGVGYAIVYDSVLELVYVTKKDYAPKDKNILFVDGKFTFNGLEIKLGDPVFFDNISFTISFNLDKGFCGFHDFGKEANLHVQTENHFIVTRGNEIYKHNEEEKNFTQYFGVDHGFEIEPVINTGQSVHILSSLEFILEAYRVTDSLDRFHILDEGFDSMQIFNTEQCSPKYILVPKPKDIYEADTYPKFNGVDYIITYSKEEHKYRVNQFWDSVKDRGEFSKLENSLFITSEDGYNRTQNPLALDLKKPEEERKKFRHTFNRVRFKKNKSNNVSFIFKFLNGGIKNSPR